jgi:hypothetical protein
LADQFIICKLRENGSYGVDFGSGIIVAYPDFPSVQKVAEQLTIANMDRGSYVIFQAIAQSQRQSSPAATALLGATVITSTAPSI